MKGIPPLFLSRLSAFRRGQLSPWDGTGQMAPLWAVQSRDHSQTCGQRLIVSPVFRLDHSSLHVCVCWGGQGGTNHVHVCLSCESLMLQSDKRCSPTDSCSIRDGECQSYGNVGEVLFIGDEPRRKFKKVRRGWCHRYLLIGDAGAGGWGSGAEVGSSPKTE